MTLSSHKISRRICAGNSPISELYRNHKSRICRSQLLIKPKSGFSTAERSQTPPKCPQTIISSILSTSKAYWTTDKKLRSNQMFESF